MSWPPTLIDMRSSCGLNRPGELETLRSVYGSRLVVIGVYSPRDKRAAHLEERIKSSRKNSDRKTWAHQAPELIERDEKEEMKGGQDLRGTFHRADFFIRGWDREVAQRDLDRILELLFGSPFRTPTRDEHAQFLAAGAALRSSEFGRQVGAAIATPDGSVIAVGANEVPIAGGGSHWEEDGPGNRDFEIGDTDTNRRNLNQLAEQVAEEIDTEFSGLFDEADESDGAAERIQAAIRTELPEVLRTSSIKQKFAKEKAAPILSESGLPDFIPEFSEYRAKELAALDYFLEHAGKE